MCLAIFRRLETIWCSSWNYVLNDCGDIFSTAEESYFRVGTMLDGSSPQLIFRSRTITPQQFFPMLSVETRKKNITQKKKKKTKAWSDFWGGKRVVAVIVLLGEINHVWAVIALLGKINSLLAVIDPLLLKLLLTPTRSIIGTPFSPPQSILS